MAALTQDRNTPHRAAEDFSFPVAAGVTCHAGGLAAMIVSSTGAGNVTPGATATNLRGVGRFEETVANAGAAGAVNVKVSRGCFRFANEATDLVGLEHVGQDCFIVDDQTVAATNGTNTRSVAGVVRDVDAEGVWVEF